jgi:nucleoid-associated protein YgaU
VTNLTAPVVGLVGWLALACLGWLVLLAALTAVAQRRVGAVRWVAQLLVNRLAPASVRAAVAVAIGGALVTGSTPAWAGPLVVPVVPAPVVPLDWPRESTELDVPSEPTRSPAAPAAVPMPDVVGRGASAPAVTRTVVVQPGDSLWAIARRSLGPAATVRETAETWPLWWRANRQLIGDDPDLIRPGMPLTSPFPGARSIRLPEESR